MNIDRLNSVVTRTTFIVYAIGACLVPIVGVLTWALVQANDTIDRISRERPIMVVPGAMAGVYSAGLTEQALLDQCRYLGGLWTVFTHKDAKQRFDELDAYADDAYLIEFDNMKDARLRTVQDRTEGASFSEIKDSAVIASQKNGSYSCSIRGNRQFTSGGLVLNNDVGEFQLTFKLGAASEKNKYGIRFTNIDAPSVSAAPAKGSKP